MFAGHKAKWTIILPDNTTENFNCFYDSVDYCSQIAEKFKVDYKNKVIYILK